MRSGGQKQRTPTTDFVQEYAAKRQLQMELAKKIREERLQRGERDPSGTGVGVAPKSKENLTTLAQACKNPPPSTGISKAIPDHAASNSIHKLTSNSFVLQVTEDDLKEATKAGIITPDQARQLWAMLSNQLIRIAAPSQESLSTTFFSTTATSLLTLSTTAASPTDIGSIGNRHSSPNSAAKGSLIGSGKRCESKFAFGESISLESLRQSIAYFKEQQHRGDHDRTQKHQQEVDVQDLKKQHMHHYYPEEDIAEANYVTQAPSHEVDQEINVQKTYKGPVFEKNQMNSNIIKKKPDWNFDVNVDGSDSKERNPSDQSPRNIISKSLAAKLIAPKAKASDSGNKYDGLSKPRFSANGKDGVQRFFPHQGDEMIAHVVNAEEGCSLRNTTTADNNNKFASAAPRASATFARASLVNYDDIPIIPKIGQSTTENTSATLKNTSSVPTRKRKEARVSGLTSKVMGETAENNLSSDNDRILAEAASVANEPTRECAICNRTFRVSVLARHEPLCRKQSSKRRKIFNMQARRLEGVEGIDHVRPNAGVNNNCNLQRSNAITPGNPNKIAKWRIQHEQFQAAMRAVHQHKGMMQDPGARNSNGKSVGLGYSAPSPMPALPPEFDDRVLCPHCSRKFAEDVAARHIPKCANTIAKPKGIRPIRR